MSDETAGPKESPYGNQVISDENSTPLDRLLAVSEILIDASSQDMEDPLRKSFAEIMANMAFCLSGITSDAMQFYVNESIRNQRGDLLYCAIKIYWESGDQSKDYREMDNLIDEIIDRELDTFPFPHPYFYRVMRLANERDYASLAKLKELISNDPRFAAYRGDLLEQIQNVTIDRVG